MKKTVIAVFSVSLTAGTCYLIYTELKSHLIKQLMQAWKEESKKRGKELSVEQVEYLKVELDKLNAWQIKRLANYSEQAINRAPEKIILPLLAKLKEKKILEKVDLKAVDGILFGT